MTLTLGLGANTAVFSILYGLLLESLPVQRPHELARLVESRHQSPTPYEAFTYKSRSGEPMEIVGVVQDSK